MTTAERAINRGTQRASRSRTELAGEVRHSRVGYGLSQAEVARAAGISKSQLSRIERAQVQTVSVLVLARLLAVLGMELSARAYPAGQPIRDKAHRALLERLRKAMPGSFVWTNERPLPAAGDQRAWDAAVKKDELRLVVEAETRLSDLQSVERRLRLKLRDDPSVDGCLLLLAETKHNRTVLRANLGAFAGFERITASELPRIRTGGNRLVFL